jgi:hypothetical protein
MLDELGFWRKRRGLFQGTIPVFTWVGGQVMEVKKISVGIVDVPAEIRTFRIEARSVAVSANFLCTCSYILEHILM